MESQGNFRRRLVASECWYFYIRREKSLKGCARQQVDIRIQIYLPPSSRVWGYGVGGYQWVNQGWSSADWEILAVELSKYCMFLGNRHVTCCKHLWNLKVLLHRAPSSHREATKNIYDSNSLNNIRFIDALLTAKRLIRKRGARLDIWELIDKKIHVVIHYNL